VSGEGLEWAYLDASSYATTDEYCPGARRSVFVAGYLPAASVSCGDKPAESNSWMDWITDKISGDKAQDGSVPENADSTTSTADQ
jgi:penicillin-binding protein 1B